MAIDEVTGINEETAGGKPLGRWRRVLVIGLVIAGLLAGVRGNAHE